MNRFFNTGLLAFLIAFSATPSPIMAQSAIPSVKTMKKWFIKNGTWAAPVGLIAIGSLALKFRNSATVAPVTPKGFIGIETHKGESSAQKMGKMLGLNPNEVKAALKDNNGYFFSSSNS